MVGALFCGCVHGDWSLRRNCRVKRRKGSVVCRVFLACGVYVYFALESFFAQELARADEMPENLLAAFPLARQDAGEFCGVPDAMRFSASTMDLLVIQELFRSFVACMDLRVFGKCCRLQWNTARCIVFFCGLCFPLVVFSCTGVVSGLCFSVLVFFLAGVFLS